MGGVKESRSFRSYYCSVRSFRPEFWGESFRPKCGGSFQPNFKDGSFRWPDFRGESFRPDLFILGKTGKQSSLICNKEDKQASKKKKEREIRRKTKQIILRTM